MDRQLAVSTARSGTVRYWQPTADSIADLTCASLDVGQVSSHIHENWQFAVSDLPAGLSLGAYRRFVVRAAEVTVIPPFHVHAEDEAGIGPAPQWRSLYVAPVALARFRRDATFNAPVFHDPAAAAALRDLLRASEDGVIEPSEFRTRSLAWLERVVGRHAGLTAGPGGAGATVERARTYLQQRPTKAVVLSEVAAAAGVSVSHLERSFSRIVGLAPRAYHLQVRLAHARRLLAQGKSASWTAYECGFSDQSHLSRRFRECYGVTPGAFQAQQRAARVDARGRVLTRLTA